MDIGIIGVGYVGLVTGACLAELGNTVTCADINNDKIQILNDQNIPFFEPGLDQLVRNNHQNDKISFTTNIEQTISDNTTLMIAVDTPQSYSGEANLSYVFDVARKIGQTISGHKFILIKSTVPVGTCHKVKEVIIEELKIRNIDNITFDVISNPEFLREGSAIKDFTEPDRIICGYESSEARIHLEKLYLPFSEKNIPVLYMDLLSSEMTKYASNAMLATKISFTNEMALICEQTGADISKVCEGMGSDHRIGNKFINPGIGYGGSCFPKDVSALIHTAKINNVTPKVLNAVKQTNFNQRKFFVQKILEYFNNDLSNLSFAVWGLSYKPNTDDMRDAPSITIINELIKQGANVFTYDPKANSNAKSFFKSDQVKFKSSALEALNNCDALLLLTEWDEFKNPDFDQIKSLLKNPVIFDGRNQYDKQKLNSLGFDYYSVGR